MRIVPKYKAVTGVVLKFLWLMLPGLYGAVAHASDTMDMSANILQSACTISFIKGTSSTGTSVTSVVIPDANADAFTASPGSCSGTACLDDANSTPVTLKLSGCGVAMDSTTPTVTLTGANAQLADVPSSDASRGYMFRDAGAAGGTSKEFAVVVGKISDVTWSSTALYNSNAGLQGGGAENSVITLTGGGKGTSGEGAYSNLWLTVACGKGCNSQTARAGTLNASLIFSFAYK